MRSSQAGTERVMKLRLDSWQKVKHIDQKDLVFLDETGVLRLLNQNSCFQRGTRAYAVKPFYAREKSHSNWCN